nr:sphingoid long-chain bases kinase 1 [Quercus suber]
MSELYTDIMRRSSKDSIPRASSLSSIDSIMTPSRMSGEDLDTSCSSTHASTEPSDYVRGLDLKVKRLSSGRSNVTAEPEVIHPQPPLSTTPIGMTHGFMIKRNLFSKWAYQMSKSLIK